MNSQVRVQTALQRQIPDRVPYCELHIDRALAQKLMGWGEPLNQSADLEANIYTVDEEKAIASFLGLDNISYTLRAPVFAQKEKGKDGRLFYGEGMIKCLADLSKVVLPDPYSDELYAEAENFVRQKGDFSAWMLTRAGVFPTILSMGTQDFCVALYDNRRLIEELLDRYFEWVQVVADRICHMGFDVFVSTDDMAFKTGPLFSPAVFREFMLPRYQRLAEKITIPWIIHSDGNLTPLVPDLLSLGIVGMHPFEKGAMDIRSAKQEYGDRICLLGNVDLGLLTLGSPEEVDQEVYGLIRDVAGGGGYIVTSGNSLAGYLKVENVIALAEAVRKYGDYSKRTAIQEDNAG